VNTDLFKTSEMQKENEKITYALESTYIQINFKNRFNPNNYKLIPA